MVVKNHLHSSSDVQEVVSGTGTVLSCTNYLVQELLIKKIFLGTSCSILKG
jgi:hypothetical protein